MGKRSKNLFIPIPQSHAQPIKIKIVLAIINLVKHSSPNGEKPIKIARIARGSTSTVAFCVSATLLGPYIWIQICFGVGFFTACYNWWLG